MTFAEMKIDCYDLLRFDTSPGTVVARRIGGFLNQVHNEILGLPGAGIKKLRRRVLPVSTVANTPYMVLPSSVDMVYGLLDRTNSRPLSRMTWSGLNLLDPGQSAASSTPTAWAEMDLAYPVALDPSNASELFLKSTSASDTQAAYLEGYTSDGTLRAVTVAALTGTTAVSVSAAITTWIAVTKFYLASAAVGVVSLYEDSGSGTQLGSIGIGRTRGAYSRLQVYPTPSAAATLYAHVDIALLPMILDTDECFLPSKFHWLLPCGAARLEMLPREKSTTYALMDARYNRGVSALRHYLSPMTDEDAASPEWSQLGAHYPHGS